MALNENARNYYGGILDSITDPKEREEVISGIKYAHSDGRENVVASKDELRRLGQQALNPTPPPEQMPNTDENRSDFVSGVKRGIDTTQAMLYGGTALAGRGLEAVGLDDVGKNIKDFGMEGYKRNMNEATMNPAKHSFKDVYTGKAGIGGTIDWAQGTLGELVPSMVEAAVGTFIGATVGSAVGPEGTIGGAFGGALAGRTLMKKAIDKITSQAIQSQIKKGLIKEGAEATIEAGLKKEITRQALKKVGGKIGMGAAILPMESGGMYAGLLDENGIDAPGTALFFGTLSTAMEYAGGNSHLVDTMVDAISKGKNGLIKKTAKELLANIPEEAIQEGGQELMQVFNRLVNTDDKFSVKDIEQIVEAMGAGAVGGAGGAVVSGVLESDGKKVEKKGPSDPEKMVAGVDAGKTPIDILKDGEKGITPEDLIVGGDDIKAASEFTDQELDDEISQGSGKDSAGPSKLNGETFEETAKKFEENLKRAQAEIKSYPERAPIQPDTEALKKEYEQGQAKKKRDKAGTALEDHIRERNKIDRATDNYQFQNALQNRPQELERMPLPSEMPGFQRRIESGSQTPFSNLEQQIVDSKRGTPAPANIVEGGYDTGLDVDTNAQYIPNSVIDQRNFQRALGDDQYFGMQDLGGNDMGMVKIPLATDQSAVSPQDVNGQDTGTPQAQKMSYEDFKLEYKKIFDEWNKWTPDQVGSKMYGEQLAKLEDTYPEFAQRFESEMIKAKKGTSDEDLVSSTTPDQAPATPGTTPDQAPATPGTTPDQAPATPGTTPDHAPAKKKSKLGLPDKDQQAFIDKRIKTLGSVDVVDQAYVLDDAVGRYARAKARELFGEQQAPATEKKQEMPQPKSWFDLGERATFAYKDKTGKSDPFLKPNPKILKETAEKLGISVTDMQRGLSVYHSGNPQHDEKLFKDKKVPRIKNEQTPVSAPSKTNVDDTRDQVKPKKVSWTNKAGNAQHGEIIQKKKGSNNLWWVKQDNGKQVLVNEKDFTTAPATPQVTPDQAPAKTSLDQAQAKKQEIRVSQKAKNEPQTDLKSTNEPQTQVKDRNNGRVYLSDNSQVDFKYEVVDVKDLVTSHDDNMEANKDFPPELQPRDRGDRKAYLLQVDDIAKKLNPELLASSPTATHGAPMIGMKNNFVESGNGRTIAIRKALTQNTEQGRAYREWVKANLEDFGLSSKNIEGIENPVLVRRRTTQVEDESTFTKTANKADIATFSPSEQATMDADAMTPEDIALFRPDQDGNVTNQGNKGFVDAFLEKMSASERVGYLTEDGRANSKLADRIKAAIFKKAYDSKELSIMVTEETSTDIKNILNGLIKAAPNFVKARMLSDNFNGITVVKDIVSGIEFLRKARRENPDIKSGNGKTAIQAQLRMSLDQGSMFEAKPSNEIIAIAQFMADNNQSGKKLGEFFDHLGTGLRGFLSEKDQASMFGEKNILSTQELIDKAKSILGDKYDDKQGELFGQVDPGTKGPDKKNTDISGNREGEPGQGESGAKEKPAVTPNKFFTDDAYEKAKARMKKRLSGNTLNSGLDPELLFDGIIIAGHTIESGARTFAAYSKEMVSKFGDEIKPYLKMFYNAVREYPGFDNTGMDGVLTTEESKSLEPVDNSEADIDNRIDKKYADLEKYAEDPQAEDIADPDIYEKIQDGELTPKELEDFLKKSDNINTDISGVKYSISHRLGDLKETYKYEGFKDGKNLEEYLDSLLSVISNTGGEVSTNPMSNNGSKDSIEQENGDIPDNPGINQDKEKTDVNKQPTNTNSKQDSGNTNPGNTMGKESVPDERGTTSSGDGKGVQSTPEGDKSGGGEIGSGHEAVTPGKQSDQSPYRAVEPDATESGDAGDIDSSGSGDDSIKGEQLERTPAKRIVETAEKGADLESKIIKQKEASSIKTKTADLDNIMETLPLLYPDQAKDVLFAEKRFQTLDGKGVMFTNGTGTGKTFSGLGVAKRFHRDGKKNILIIAPDNVIINAWSEASKLFDIPMHKLEGKDDSGKDATITTYANFRDNPNLVKRSWDLIIADEAHDLGQNKSGEETGSLSMLRAATKHLRGVFARAMALNSELYSEFRAASDAVKNTPTDANRKKFATLSRQWEKAKEDVREDVAKNPAPTKVVFLSATPFAYEKSIDYAEGFLFKYNDIDSNSGGYNAPDAYQDFMIQHFGYRMRYNKLTEPESDVDRGLMQRQFNSWLKTEGVLSSRMLDVPHDYDRKFVLTHSAIGMKIDDGFDFLHSNYKKYGMILSAIANDFNYLKRRYLLEAIKAKEVIPIVKKHMELGRKVIVYHDYIKGGAENPFDINRIIDAARSQNPDGIVPDELIDSAEEFAKERPDLVNLPISNLPSPLETMKAAFPDLLVVNGQTVKKSEVQKNINTFNQDSSGPCVLMVQSDKDRGWSGHDTTGKHNRVLINLGLPTRPTRAIQQEGRIFRVGQASNAMFRYLNTGTNWERWAFADTIAQRASAAENLAMGEEARALQDSFIDAFEASDSFPAGFDGEGTGGKSIDAANNAAITEWDRAKSFYFGQQKKTSRTKAQEGKDYFATPEPLGLKMVEWADLKGNDKILEPSAGHGAIARWFPDNVEGTAVEPSNNLSSRLKMVVPGHKVIQDTFENLNVMNKYDAITMNPPFGSSGKTAMEHIEKAFKQLKNYGRLIAIVPDGPAMQKRVDSFLYGQDEKGRFLNPSAILTASIKLPSVTFERAGTKVNCKVLVVDKVNNHEALGDIHPQITKDLSNITDIKDFFDRIENIDIPKRYNESGGVSVRDQFKQATDQSKTLKVENTGHSVYPFKVSGATFQHRDVLKSLVDRDKRVWDSQARAWMFKEDPTAALKEKLGGDVIAEEQAKYSTQSPAFKKWFGDSKVVDKNGNPLVVYHGTNKDFSTFDTEKQAGGQLGKGFYFSPDPKASSMFAAIQAKRSTGTGERVIPAYISMENPYILEKRSDIPISGIDQRVLKHLGYDGVIVKKEGVIDELAVFDPEQVKSTFNQGLWDKSNPDTRFQTDQTPGQGVTLPDLQKKFKGQSVFLSPDGTVAINYKNGLGVRIESVEHIGGDDFKIAFESGQIGKNGVIFGKYKDGVITLDKSIADGETVTHELFHSLKDMKMITPVDEYTLDKLMDKLVSQGEFRYEVQKDAEENRANTLAQLIADREEYRDRSALYKLAQKVRDFIDGLFHVGRMSARKLASQIESGKIFEREPSSESNKDKGVKYQVLQAISSANTSLNQVAATFKNKNFIPGKLNIDIGGGRYDKGTGFLSKKYGTENLIFDPFNRTESHNKAVFERLSSGEKGDTVTINNVLNVIAEPGARENVIKQASKAVKSDGRAYFLIYEGNGTGLGKVTPKGWQNHMKAEGYVDEVKKYFNTVTRKGSLIIGENPKHTNDKAVWDMGLDGSGRVKFQTSESRKGFAGERYADILPGSVVGKRMEEGRGVKPGNFLDKLKQVGLDLLKETHHFPEMTTVKPSPEKSSTMEIFRRHQEVNQVAQDRAAREITSILRKLTPEEYDDFSLELILGDEVRSIKDGLRTDNNLPFGFESKAQVIRSFNAISARNKENANVSEALEKRRVWQKETAKELVKLGIMKKEILRKGDYFHHQVLQFWNDKAPDQFKSVGTSTGEVRVKWRPWMAARNGSALDYNTQYMEAELAVMAQQIAQIETQKNLNQIKKENDVLSDLKTQAKEANNSLYNAFVNEEKAKDPLFIDPMNEEKKLIAMGFSGLTRAIKNDKITYDSEFEDVVRSIKQQVSGNDSLNDDSAIQAGIDNPRLFPFLSHLLDKKHDGAQYAAMIYKGIKGKDRVLKQTLGDNFKTWRNFIPEGYKVWKPDPNKGWFYVNSIGDRILQDVLTGERTLEEKDVRKVLARGQAPFWVVPSGIANTMDNFRPFVNEGRLGQVSAKAMSLWKQYILINPLSILKYNINNMSGDLDAVLAYKPEIARPGAMKKALSDLMAWGKFKEVPDALQKELDEAQKLGVIGSGFAVQEVEDTMGMMSSNDFVNGVILEHKPSLRARWWQKSQNATQIRENILRLAAYRWFKSQFEAGKTNLYGATRDTSHIDNLLSKGQINEAAARLARDLLGDYGNISRHGEYIRKHLIPFWSWNEINLPRYVWMMRNLKSEGSQTGALGLTMAKRTAVFAAKASMLAGAVILYNSTMWPDEWDELGESKRNQLHLILGRRGDGSIITLRFQGALSDALSWFGKEDFPDDIKDLVKGKSTIQEQLLDAVKATGSRLINSMRPDTKVLYETLTGKSTYPDAFNPMPIRDKVENVLKTFKLDSFYRHAIGRPGQGGDVATQLMNDLAGVVTYTTTPGVQAYYDIRKKVFEWKDKNGYENSGGSPTKKGNALYYYKQAQRYGDLPAAKRYLEKYFELGGTREGLKLSIQMAHPLAGIKKTMRMGFVNGLSEHDKKRYEMALKWYRETYLEKRNRE